MMWGYRWAKERNLGRLGMRETEPPDWITKYAGWQADTCSDQPIQQY